MSILDKIIENTRLELQQKMAAAPLSTIRGAAEKTAMRPSFFSAIAQDGINIIAEVKKASPSKGVICEDFDPARIAGEYERGGAAAVSVLTDRTFFQGDLNYLDHIADRVNLPLLRKDFIIHEYQVYEAKMHRASAVLLLAAALDGAQLDDYISLAAALGMDALVEVHNADELEKVMQTSAKIIGVNNRDLKTFQVDLQTSEALSALIPSDKIKVSESGIHNHDHILRLQQAGFDAFLIGESLMRQKSRVQSLKKLRGL